MTTIIGSLKDWELTIHWDKRVSWWYNIISHIRSKISNFDWVLVWLCWDFIDRDYLEELYNVYIKENKEIKTKWDAISFHKYLLETSWKTDVDIMIMSKDIQVIVSQWWLDIMEINDNEWFFSMWSWFVSALTLYRYNKSIPIKSMYDIISHLDFKTSKEFNSLTITTWNKKTST